MAVAWRVDLLSIEHRYLLGGTIANRLSHLRIVPLPLKVVPKETVALQVSQKLSMGSVLMDAVLGKHPNPLVPDIPTASGCDA